MTDERRDHDLGMAPTTPGDAAGTLDVPASDRVAPSPELGPGTTVGHFVLHKRLGAGGMGVVYAGEDVDLRRPVAIKLVRDDTGQPGHRARLLREAQAMARLEHPNVVRVYEIGEDRGQLFIAMELVDGITLAHWLQTVRPWHEVLAMFVEVGDGLAAVHRAGLVHRDFKPDNVLVDAAGKARVADFGLARLDAGAPTMTQSGALLGTPGYIAPEQQFAPQVDARADQYSFCVALREALAGRPSNDARWRAVPESVRAAVTRGLAFDPVERFASLDALLEVLRGTRHRPRRWPIAVAVLGALAAAGGATALIAHDDSRSTASPTAAPPAAAPRAATTPNTTAPTAAAPTTAVAAMPNTAGPPAAVPAAVKPTRRADKPVAPPPMTSAPFVTATQPCCPPKKPAANRDDPGHLPLYRLITRQLGYDGLPDDRPLDELAAALDQQLAAAADRAAAAPFAVQRGMIDRKRGDCPGAIARWTDAAAALQRAEDPTARSWRARAQLGHAVCELGDGHADAAYQYATLAWSDGNRDAAALVMALAAYDRGDVTLMIGQITTAQHPHGDARYQAALTALVDGTGFRLDCVKCPAAPP